MLLWRETELDHTATQPGEIWNRLCLVWESKLDSAAVVGDRLRPRCSGRRWSSTALLRTGQDPKSITQGARDGARSCSCGERQSSIEMLQIRQDLKLTALGARDGAR